MSTSRFARAVAAAGAMALSMACGESEPSATQEKPMSFFITSVGTGAGANLGGLAGADHHCQQLADATGVVGVTWHAYLSAAAAGGQPAVNARDRIGTGPWYNATGVLVAESVEQLHGDNPHWAKETVLNEKGQVVNGRGDQPNTHDMLTGSGTDGRLMTGIGDITCTNWTSSGTGAAQLGHHDEQGGGENPTSWNSAHISRGCSQQNLVDTGGSGLFYCFAVS